MDQDNGNAADSSTKTGASKNAGSSTASPSEGGEGHVEGELVDISPENPQREEIDELTMSELEMVEDEDLELVEAEPSADPTDGSGPKAAPPPPPSQNQKKPSTQPGYPAPPIKPGSVEASAAGSPSPTSVSEDTVKVSLEKLLGGDATEEYSPQARSRKVVTGHVEGQAQFPAQPPAPASKDRESRDPTGKTAQAARMDRAPKKTSEEQQPPGMLPPPPKRFPTLPPDHLTEKAAAAVRLADGEDAAPPQVHASPPPEAIKEFPAPSVTSKETEPIPTVESDSERLVSLIQEQLEHQPPQGCADSSGGQTVGVRVLRQATRPYQDRSVIR